MTGATDDHPDEHLHALAVDEHDVEVPDAARAHVADCARCGALIDDERAVRSVLGGLPPVEPPGGFISGLVRRRHRRALAVCLAGVTGAVVLWALVVGGESGVVGTVTPEIAALRARHLEAVGSGAVFEVMDDDADMPAPYRSPASLAETFEQSGRYHREGAVQVTYRDGAVVLSLFEQAGRLDPDDLPGAMAPMAVGDGWELAGPPVRVVVVRRGDLVYTLVGEADMATIREAVEDLPAERPLGLDRRVTAALDELFEDFGLGL